MIHEFGSAGFDRLIESEQSERAALISPKVAASNHGSVSTDRNLSVQPGKGTTPPAALGGFEGARPCRPGFYHDPPNQFEVHEVVPSRMRRFANRVRWVEIETRGNSSGSLAL